MVSIPRLGAAPRVASPRPVATPRALPPSPGSRIGPSSRRPALPPARDVVGRAIPGGWALLRQRLSRLTVMTVALLVVGVVGLFQVLQTTQVAKAGYDVSALEREQTSLDADIRLLEAQIAQTSNLEQIRADASKRLGMVPAERVVHVSVDTPSPALIPLPRRYVPTPDKVPARHISWWETVQGKIPGLH